MMSKLIAYTELSRCRKTRAAKSRPSCPTRNLQLRRYLEPKPRSRVSVECFLKLTPRFRMFPENHCDRTGGSALHCCGVRHPFPSSCFFRCSRTFRPSRLAADEKSFRSSCKGVSFTHILILRASLFTCAGRGWSQRPRGCRKSRRLRPVALQRPFYLSGGDH
jgi:hypothetical protein